MPLAIAICEDRYFCIEIESLSKNARPMSLEYMNLKERANPRNPDCTGRLNTVDLLVLTSLNLQILKLPTLFAKFFYKKLPNEGGKLYNQAIYLVKYPHWEIV